MRLADWIASGTNNGAVNAVADDMLRGTCRPPNQVTFLSFEPNQAAERDMSPARSDVLPENSRKGRAFQRRFRAMRSAYIAAGAAATIVRLGKR